MLPNAREIDYIGTGLVHSEICYPFYVRFRRVLHEGAHTTERLYPGRGLGNLEFEKAVDGAVNSFIASIREVCTAMLVHEGHTKGSAP
jgi:hypothetical protein